MTSSLYCTALCCTTLYCTALHFTAHHCTTGNCNTLRAIMHCTADPPPRHYIMRLQNYPARVNPRPRFSHRNRHLLKSRYFTMVLDLSTLSRLFCHVLDRTALSGLFHHGFGSKYTATPRNATATAISP